MTLFITTWNWVRLIMEFYCIRSECKSLITESSYFCRVMSNIIRDENLS